MKNILHPMTDFVLAQEESSTLDKSQIDFYDEELGKLQVIRSYAKFLKQPLTLSMFVPCDEEGNILEEPERIHFSTQFDFKAELDVFAEAKERCLFEGINSVWVEHGEFKIQFGSVKEDWHEYVCTNAGKNPTIEFMAATQGVYLTETALKHIYG